MELFSAEPMEPDDDLLSIFAQIGAQVGQYIQRKQAETARLASEDRLHGQTSGRRRTGINQSQASEDR